MVKVKNGSNQINEVSHISAILINYFESIAKTHPFLINCPGYST